MSRAHRPRLGPGEILAVAFGGAAGATARAGLTLALPDGSWALTTLCINVAGCIVLAGLNVYAAHRPVNDMLRAGLGTGFCGAFTTYSTIMLLFMSFEPWRYAAYLLLTVVLCLLAVRAVVVLGGKLLGRGLPGGTARP